MGYRGAGFTLLKKKFMPNRINAVIALRNKIILAYNSEKNKVVKKRLVRDINSHNEYLRRNGYPIVGKELVGVI